MSMIFSLWTIVVMIIFLGITIWAWSGKNKKRFDSAARIPLDDELDGATENNDEELKNG